MRPCCHICFSVCSLALLATVSFAKENVYTNEDLDNHDRKQPEITLPDRGAAPYQPQDTPLPGGDEDLRDTPSSTGDEDLTVAEHYLYYPVAGSTARELRMQMKRSGPVDSRGRHGYALTDSVVRWYYTSMKKGAAHCSLRQVKVRADVTYTYPRWDIPVNTPPDLREKWNTFLRALQVHEEGHKRIAIDASYELLGIVKGLPPQPCSKLENVVNGVFRKISRRIRNKEIRYDKATRHGETQGARLQ